MESKMEPEDNISFAKIITTQLNWNDVIVDERVLEQIDEINKGLSRGETPVKAFFRGAPGTGKTLVATLIGKTVQRDVYRVDLSNVVSKHIDETERNLTRIFDAATSNGWILFFDEADALFGKRTFVRDAHNRYANQEVAYLLKKIEEFPGMAILASDSKEDVGDDFTRKFQSIIDFKMPSAQERYILWQNAFAGALSLDEDVDLHQISEQYVLSGGSILNVVRYCALASLKRADTLVKKQDILDGIKMEH